MIPEAEGPLGRWNANRSGLRISLDPIEGESVPGWVARSFARNVVPDITLRLPELGVDVARITALAALRGDQAAVLDRALGASDGTAAALAGSVREGTVPHCVVVNGVAIPAGHCERRLRRYAPAALRSSPHHRASWLVRTLPICPETRQALESRCPACLRALGWTRAEGISWCEWCRAEGLPTVDLRAVEGSFPPVHDPEAVDWFCSLFWPAGAGKSVRNVVPQALRNLDAGSHYRLAVALRQVIESLRLGKRATVPVRLKEPIWSIEDVEGAGRAVLDWPASVRGLAESARENARDRPGAWGISRELGPLLHATRYDFLPPDLRRLFKECLDLELAASVRSSHGIARFGSAPQHPAYATMEQAAAATGASRKAVTALSCLDGSGAVTWTGPSRQRRKLPIRTVDRLAWQFGDAEAGRELALRLGVASESICAVADIVGIEAMPLGYRQARGGRRLFRRSSSSTFEERLTIHATSKQPGWKCFRESYSNWPNLATAMAFAFRLASEGALPFSRDAGASDLGRGMHADPHALHAAVRRRWLDVLRAPSIPRDLDAGGACAVLACSPTTLARIVSAGLLPLPNKRRPRHDPIVLHEFRERYCTLAEAAMQLGMAPVNAWRLFELRPYALAMVLPGGGTLLHRRPVDDVVASNGPSQASVGPDRG